MKLSNRVLQHFPLSPLVDTSSVTVSSKSNEVIIHIKHQPLFSEHRIIEELGLMPHISSSRFGQFSLGLGTQSIHIPIFSEKAQAWIQQLHDHEKQAIALLLSVMNLFDPAHIHWIQELIELMVTLDPKSAEEIKTFIFHDTVPHFLDVTIAYNTLIADDSFRAEAAKLGFHFHSEYRLSPRHDIAEYVKISEVLHLIERFKANHREDQIPNEIFRQIDLASENKCEFLNVGKLNPFIAQEFSAKPSSFALELHRLCLHHSQILQMDEVYAQHAMLERIIDVISGLRQKRLYKESKEPECIMHIMTETAKQNRAETSLGDRQNWIEDDERTLGIIQLVLDFFVVFETDTINKPLVHEGNQNHPSPFIRMVQEKSHIFFYDLITPFHTIYNHLFDPDSLIL